MNIRPLALALAFIVLDLAVVILALLAGIHPGPPSIAFNAVALAALFILLASRRIRFRN